MATVTRPALQCSLANQLTKSDLKIRAVLDEDAIRQQWMVERGEMILHHRVQEFSFSGEVALPITFRKRSANERGGDLVLALRNSDS
jgi:hypothetical protein